MTYCKILVVALTAILLAAIAGSSQDAEFTKLIWSRFAANNIDVVNLDDLNLVNQIFAANVFGLAFNHRDGRLYRTEPIGIVSSNLNGSDRVVHTFLTGDKLDFDYESGYMYWIHEGWQLFRCQPQVAFDCDNPDLLFANSQFTGLNDMRLSPERNMIVLLNAKNATISWLPFNDPKSLNSANILVGAALLKQPFGMDLDTESGALYWADAALGHIARCTISTEPNSCIDSFEVVLEDLNVPLAVQLDIQNSKMYWTEFSAATINRANLDGTNVEVLVTGAQDVEELELGF